MYRARYEYNGPMPGYLSFRAGDQFTVIKEVNKDWYRAQNGLGEIGNVPCNYVTQVQHTAEEVLKFVDWSIEAIHLQATSEGGGKYTHEQRATLQTLVQHRSDLAKQLQSKAPLERSRSEDVRGQEPPRAQEEKSRRQSERRRAPAPPSDSAASQQRSSKHSAAPAPPPSNVGTNGQPPTNLPDVLPSPLRMEHADHAPPELDAALSPNGNSTSQNNTPPDLSLIKTPPDVPQNIVPLEILQDSSAQAVDENAVASGVSGNHSAEQPVLENEAVTQASGDDSAVCASKEVDMKEALKGLEVPDKIGPELLEEVRKSTGLSFQKSKVAVETVLGYVGFQVPALEGLMDKLLSSLHFGRDISDEDVSSHDAQRLGVIFSELTACKDDSQQRSWALHEDEVIIREYLQELLSILENAKPSICRKVVSRDNYDILHNLVQYYQMENRPGLCLLLLKVFGGLCALEREVVTQLLFSVLPLELGQDLQLHSHDVQRICYVALVMTMMFSTGDGVSTAVTDQFNQEFFLHILNLIESPPSVQFEDEAVDTLIAFVLAFNLHLTSVDTNVVLRSLATIGTPKVFTERIMLLINRGDDPAKMFEFQPQPPNSVVKLFHDLFADLTTADLLYTNDAKVLMDVIVGRLSNLDPGDEVRSSFLVLCDKVLQNSLYAEHGHRARDLQQCLLTICSEEADTPADKRTALHILSNNPDVFPND